MTFEELKMEIEKSNFEEILNNYKGFEEKHDLKHYKTYFEMLNEPFYTLMQFQDSEEFKTKSDQWVLCLPQGDQLVVMDLGTEEEICDQFFNLMEILKYGFGTAEIRPKIIEE